MKLLVAGLMVLLAGPCFAVDPGTQVTVTLPDGSVVNGVVVSSAPAAEAPAAPPSAPQPATGYSATQPVPQTPGPAPAVAPGPPVPPSAGLGTPQQPLGFATPPQTATFIGVPVVPVQPLTREQKQEFLKQQAAEREARKHEATTPQSDWQFDLQQAIDRQAHGLPFNAPSQR